MKNKLDLTGMKIEDAEALRRFTQCLEKDGRFLNDVLAGVLNRIVLRLQEGNFKA